MRCENAAIKGIQGAQILIIIYSLSGVTDKSKLTGINEEYKQEHAPIFMLLKKKQQKKNAQPDLNPVWCGAVGGGAAEQHTIDCLLPVAKTIKRNVQ